MTTQLFSNNAETAPSAQIEIVDTVIAVTDGSIFSSPGATEHEMVTFNEGANVEIVKMTSRSGNNLTVVRAQEGTVAQVFSISAFVTGNVTGATLASFPQGFDNGGDAKGTNAITLQPGRAFGTEVASGTASTAISIGSTASASYAMAIGPFSTANQTRALAVGYSALASGIDGVAVGYEAAAANTGCTAIGIDTEASGVSSTAVGDQARTDNTNGTAIGFQAYAGGISSTALGTGADANASSSISIGGSTADGSNSIAIGSISNAMGINSVAIGRGAVSTGSGISFGNFVRSRLNYTCATPIAEYTQIPDWLAGAEFSGAGGTDGYLFSELMDLTGGTQWAATTAYNHGEIIEPVTPNGWQYQWYDSAFPFDDTAYTPSSSGGSEPTWPTTLGDGVTDGGGDWIAIPNTNYVLGFPTNGVFMVHKIGVIVYDYDTITVAPVVTLGTSGDNSQFVDALALEGLTAQWSVQEWYLQDPAIVSDIRINLDTLATGTELAVRFYFKGMFLRHWI